MAGVLDSTTLGVSPTYTVSSVGSPGQLYASTGISTGWTSTVDPTLTVSQSGMLDLQGDNADIRINGESLMDTLRTIQDRLNMLRPNTELEAEWDQLRELGDQYRKLEAEFKEKSKMWNTLKK